MTEQHKTGLQAVRERNELLRVRQASKGKRGQLPHTKAAQVIADHIKGAGAAERARIAGQVVDVLDEAALRKQLRGVDPEPKGDTTGSERQQRRRTRKDAKAQAAGWDNWSAFETAVLNDKVKLPKAK